MHPLRKKRLAIVFLITLVSSLSIGLLVYALRDAADFFYPPSDVVSGEAPRGKRIRVGGMVVKNSVLRDPDTLAVSFAITDFQAQLTVSYQGILPDLFAENEGVVAVGILQQDGTFVADHILAKHDENYMPPEVAETLKNKDNTSSD